MKCWLIQPAGHWWWSSYLSAQIQTVTLTVLDHNIRSSYVMSRYPLDHNDGVMWWTDADLTMVQTLYSSLSIWPLNDGADFVVKSFSMMDTDVDLTSTLTFSSRLPWWWVDIVDVCADFAFHAIRGWRLCAPCDQRMKTGSYEAICCDVDDVCADFVLHAIRGWRLVHTRQAVVIQRCLATTSPSA
jgi:hypothetical protein